VRRRPPGAGGIAAVADCLVGSERISWRRFSRQWLHWLLAVAVAHPLASASCYTPDLSTALCLNGTTQEQSALRRQREREVEARAWRALRLRQRWRLRRRLRQQLRRRLLAIAPAALRQRLQQQ
jgi:hypothetical protein